MGVCGDKWRDGGRRGEVVGRWWGGGEVLMRGGWVGGGGDGRGRGGRGGGRLGVLLEGLPRGFERSLRMEVWRNLIEFFCRWCLLEVERMGVDVDGSGAPGSGAG